jgi:2-amino-4-hydroxy-6-hydroxymethyldihydropteridine diphosphokinase
VTRVFISTFLALGSNLGDREMYLRKALPGLREQGIETVRTASVYETEPKDVGDQPWFLNTVIEAKTHLSAREVLDACLFVERQNQRVRGGGRDARSLDIDVLFYGNQIVHEDGLSIPHPRLIERKFVLTPLAEIAPDFVDPLTGQTIATLLRQCTDPSEVRTTPIVL